MSGWVDTLPKRTVVYLSYTATAPLLDGALCLHGRISYGTRSAGSAKTGAGPRQQRLRDGQQRQGWLAIFGAHSAEQTSQQGSREGIVATLMPVPGTPDSDSVSGGGGGGRKRATTPERHSKPSTSTKPSPSPSQQQRTPRMLSPLSAPADASTRSSSASASEQRTQQQQQLADTRRVLVEFDTQQGRAAMLPAEEGA